MKDFFHDISDVLLALVIVAVCAGIIFWRMNVILDYPDKIVDAQTSTEQSDAADK